MVAFSVKEIWFTCFTQMRYLKDTRENSTVLIPSRGIDLEVYVDAYPVGNSDLKETEDQDTAISIEGYIIMYAGCWHVPGLVEDFLSAWYCICVFLVSPFFNFCTVKLILRYIYIYIYVHFFLISIASFLL